MKFAGCMLEIYLLMFSATLANLLLKYCYPEFRMPVVLDLDSQPQKG